MSRGRLFLTLLPLVLILTACAKSGSGGSTRAAAVDSKPPATGCGSYAAKLASDPDGVLAGRDRGHGEAYLGYAAARKSAGSDLKLSHAPPYHIEFILAGALNQFQIDATAELKRLVAADKEIGTANFA